MKKHWTSAIVIALVALLAAGVAGASIASAAAPEGQGRRAGRDLGPAHVLRQVAELLEMSPRAVIEELRDGKTIADLAGEKGVSTDQVMDSVSAPFEARTGDLRGQGLLTQAQADELNTRARERIADIVTLPFPYGRRGEALRTAAATIGISIEELIGELEAGKSIAEVAEANNTTAKAVVDALVAAREQSLQELVSLDLLTETQANIAAARYREMAEQAVERTGGEGGSAIASRPARGVGAGRGDVPGGRVPLFR